MPHALSPTGSDVGASEDVALPDIEESNEVSSPSSEANDTIMEDATQHSTQPSASVKLEEMFEDGSDDGFTSSAEAAPDSSAPARSTISKANFAEPDILRQFYQRLCPFRHLFQWLNHSATLQPDFQNREFSFWLPGEGSRVIRYLSFASADLLRKQCVQMTPERFEIGPQYSLNPRDRHAVKKSSAFKPVMKELVFDIDMTDYDPIRTCCSGAKICIKCWQFIVMAVRVVDTALREDFGFQHILWVYSGRRGAHAWVSDKRAREMDDSKRKAVLSYLEVLKGNEHGKRNGLRRPLHPHVKRSLDLLTPHFKTDVLADQDPWATSQQAAKLLDLIPDIKLVTALKKKWESSSRTSQQKWDDIDAVAEADNLSTLTPAQLLNLKQDIRLEYTYPRLDAEVSKKLNHLLKSPFVIHPGTGRVCVPIDIRRLEDFDPFSVPTVTQLLDEIDQWEQSTGVGMGEEEKMKIQDWQKTSLRPYVDFFRGHVATLLKEESKGKRGRDESDAMEF